MTPPVSTAKPLPSFAGKGRFHGMDVGRPPFMWTQETEDAIFDAIMDGKSLRELTGANKPEWMPGKTTVFKRLREDKDFADRYARAREFQADAEFDEIKEIADNGSNDWMDSNDPDNPGFRLNGEHVQRSRLRVDTRKWRASKLAPKKYGERVEVEHSGEIRQKQDLSSLSDAELATLAALSEKIAPNDPPSLV